MRIKGYLFPILLILALVPSLVSCNLSKKRESVSYTEDYDKNSPLYGKTVLGVAGNAQKVYATTSDGELWERNNQKGEWTKLSEGLPNEYTRAVYLLEPTSKDGTARLVVACGPNSTLDEGQEATNGKVGICQLIYFKGNIVEMHEGEGESVHGLIRNSRPDSNAYLVTTKNNSSKAPRSLCVYNLTGEIKSVNLCDQSNIGPTEEDQILGSLEGSANFLIKFNKPEGAVYQLRGDNFKNKPLTVECPAGQEIKLLDSLNVQETFLPVVVMANNDIHPIDPETGKINVAVCIKGLGHQANVNGVALLGDTYVVTTNRGYYEIDGEEIRHPQEATTDLTSYYKQNKLNKAHISGVYKLSDGKTYLTTHERGLWFRDTETKKWKGV